MNTPPGFVPLIERTRGALTECLHYGAVVLADLHGQVLAHAGDADWPGFTRSTLKPFQALPFVAGGGARDLGFDTPMLAVMCASHNGDAEHVAQVERVLERAGVGMDALQCGSHLPLRYVYTDDAAPPGLRWDQRQHNCSGKHAGLLACCSHRGWRHADYLDPAHPLQQAIAQQVAHVAGVCADDLAWGTDGCSAPNAALPLRRLAQAHARLACASAGRDPGLHDLPRHAGSDGVRAHNLAEALAMLGRAMRDQPRLVSGEGRNDLAYTAAGRGDWISKVGADGMQVVASLSRGQALVVKISDGDKAALHAATVEALEQIGWLDDAQRADLAPWRAPHIHSLRGAVVGQRRACFRLAAPRPAAAPAGPARG